MYMLIEKSGVECTHTIHGIYNTLEEAEARLVREQMDPQWSSYYILDVNAVVTA